jgi:DeoR family transcriptional regulator of aga operon
MHVRDLQFAIEGRGFETAALLVALVFDRRIPVDDDVERPPVSGSSAIVPPRFLRRAKVLEVVRQNQFASVADLSETFGVSEVTIRSDLDVLAGEGMIRRVRGGAVHRPGPGLESPFEEVEAQRVEARREIAATAAGMVSSGQSVLLDGGVTVTATARAIAAREDLHDVTVITNSVPVALALESAIPRITVMLSGGTLRRLQHTLVNPFGTTILEQVHGHLAILEADGIDASAGVTHINVAEVEIKRLLMRAARQRVLVADAPSVGAVSLVHLYPIGELDELITSPDADPDALGALRDEGLEIRLTG